MWPSISVTTATTNQLTSSPLDFLDCVVFLDSSITDYITSHTQVYWLETTVSSVVEYSSIRVQLQSSLHWDHITVTAVPSTDQLTLRTQQVFPLNLSTTHSSFSCVPVYISTKHPSQSCKCDTNCGPITVIILHHPCSRLILSVCVLYLQSDSQL